jgi:ATP-dependent helicase/nuclease subunit A
MDGYVLTNDACYLFDYKTDYVDPQNQTTAIAQIKTRYAGQLNLYSAALAQILKRPVTHQYLYLLSIGELVALD